MYITVTQLFGCSTSVDFVHIWLCVPGRWSWRWVQAFGCIQLDFPGNNAHITRSILRMW